MWKTFVLLFCLSVALGVGYSATNGTTTATPTASNTSSTAKPPTTRNLTTPSNKSSTAKPTPTTKPTKGNTTTKPPPSTNSTTKPTVTTKPTKGNTTTKPAPSTNSTTKPTVTPKPTKGNTTKPAPSTNSTSTKPTSSPKPTNGTTSTPQSTTKKTTTVLPTPPPYGIFSLQAKGKNTTYCLLAQFAVTFTINYRANVSKGNSSKIVEKSGIIYLNGTNYKDVTIDGVCGSLNGTDAKLVLTWPKKNLYNLTMVFSEVKAKGLEAKSNSSKWRVKEIILNVTLEDNPDFKNATEKSFTSTFNGSSSPNYDVGGYYSCKSKDGTVKFNSNAVNYTVHPVFKDVKLEPFVNKNTSEAFGKHNYPCPQDMPKSTPAPSKSSDKNDIVPIAVGCALAGLVLIVLIAYIIGRRKSHRGYEKV